MVSAMLYPAQGWRLAQLAAGCPVSHKHCATTIGRTAMMRNSSIIFSVIGASALALFTMTASVQAKDAGDWTCDDFLKVSKSAQSSVVYYLVGLNKAQAKEFHDISAQDFNAPVSKVVQHCRKNRPDNLWDAIANHFYWHAMKIP
jgi:hypothetical protein